MNYVDMVSVLQPKAIGDFKLEHFEITEEALRLEKIRSIFNRNRDFDGQEPGNSVRLKYKDTVLMSDTQMERNTNSWFVYKAHGDILIGGLGIGLIILPILNRPEVKSITVIEKYQEVIKLVVPQLHFNYKVTIINDDIFKWYPPKDIKYNVIYFDIWNSICSDHYSEMKTLRRRFGRKLDRSDPNCWMDCWRAYDTKRLTKE